MEPGKVHPGGAHQVQMGGAQILAIREGREVADARAVIFDVLDGTAPKPFQIGKVAVAHHHVPQVRKPRKFRQSGGHVVQGEEPQIRQQGQPAEVVQRRVGILVTVLLAVEVDAVVHPAAVGKVIVAARVHVIALGVLFVKGIEVELVPHEHHLGHLLEIHIDAVHPGRLRRGRRGRGGDLRGRRRRRRRGLPLPEQEDGAYGQERRRAQEGQD